MKTFNIIACILILLLAIVSAVFSYFLYEKRVQFVDGWTQMSTAIQTSAKKIDEKSDKKVAPELTVEKLSHKVYTEEGLRRQLTFLTNQSKDFVDKFNNAMTGWEIMTTAIAESARSLDIHTDGKFAGKVTIEELAFDNPTFNEDDFKAKIQNLVSQTAMIAVQYRNARTGWDIMGKAIQESSAMIDGQTGGNTAASLKTLLMYNSDKFSEASFQRQIGNLTAQVKEFTTLYANTQSGWKHMQAAILTASKNMDAISDKKYADFFRKANFDNTRYNDAEFKKMIAAFVAQSDNAMKKYLATVARLKDTETKLANAEAELKRRMAQLNAMANVLATVGQKVEANGVTRDGLMDPRRYASQLNAVNSRIVQVVNNRALIVSQLEVLVKDNAGKLDSKKLLAAANASSVKTAIAPVTGLVNTQKTARIAYAGALAKIAGQLGISFKDNVNSGATATANIVEANRKKLHVELPSLKTQLANANKDIANKQNIINTRDKTIVELKEIIKNFQEAFDLAKEGGDVYAKAWGRGSVEARSVVTGTVTKVSAEYGYIVINFGTDTIVVQEVGNKRIPVNPELETGLTFNVIRDGEFIAAIKLNEVDRNESTADIPPSKAGMIKVGDKVTFQR